MILRKINDDIKYLLVASARSPNSTREHGPQLIHHYALLQFRPTDTHTQTQHAARPKPASACLDIPGIRHAGMLTLLCTIVNVCLHVPSPFSLLPYCVCGLVTECVHAI